MTTIDTGNDAPEITAEAVISELQKDDIVKKLIAKFEATLVNEDFLIDESWINRATKGFDKPNIDDRLESQTRSNVLKKLRIDAAKAAEASGEYVAPTKEAISKEANKLIDERNNELEQKKQSRLNRARKNVRAGLNIV